MVKRQVTTRGDRCGSSVQLSVRSKTIMSSEQEQKAQHLTDFSIDAILREETHSSGEMNLRFDWLKCSRYQPPKLPTERKDRCKKRYCGRSARIPFTNQQVSALEAKFRQTQYLSSSEVTEICQMLDISEIRVKIWFQNRRARQRRETQAEIQKLIRIGAYPSSVGVNEVVVPQPQSKLNESLWNL